VLCRLLESIVQEAEDSHDSTAAGVAGTWGAELVVGWLLVVRGACVFSTSLGVVAQGCV